MFFRLVARGENSIKTFTAQHTPIGIIITQRMDLYQKSHIIVKYLLSANRTIKVLQVMLITRQHQQQPQQPQQTHQQKKKKCIKY